MLVRCSPARSPTPRTTTISTSTRSSSPRPRSASRSRCSGSPRAAAASPRASSSRSAGCGSWCASRKKRLKMGQKSNPIGLRLQINRTWDSRWYAEGRNYSQLLKEDIELRKYIIESLPQAAISKVVIERPAKLCRISIYAARPGVIIGKKGADIEKLRAKLATMTESEVKLNIVEIRKPEIDAKLVAQGVADQLIRRVAFRRAMKRAVQSAL